MCFYLLFPSFAAIILPHHTPVQLLECFMLLSPEIGGLSLALKEYQVVWNLCLPETKEESCLIPDFLSYKARAFLASGIWVEQWSRSSSGAIKTMRSFGWRFLKWVLHLINQSLPVLFRLPELPLFSKIHSCSVLCCLSLELWFSFFHYGPELHTIFLNTNRNLRLISDALPTPEDSPLRRGVG